MKNGARPHGRKCLQFHGVFLEYFGKIVGWRPLLESWRPLLPGILDPPLYSNEIQLWSLVLTSLVFRLSDAKSANK